MSREPTRLEAFYGAVALVGMVLVIWERLEPEGPQELWQRLRAGVSSTIREYRGYREAMQRTLEQIEELPEVPTEPGP